MTIARNSSAEDCLTHVLLVSPAVAPPPGGIQTLTQSLFDGLSLHVHVRLVAPGASCHGRGRRLTRALRRVRRFFAPLLLPVAIIWSIWHRRTDLVHAITWRVAAPVAAIPVRWRPPLVVHCLGAELLRVGPLTRLLRNLVLKRADELISISSFTTRAVEGLCGRVPTLIAPTAPDHLPQRSATSDPHEGNRLRVLTVGRYVARKGHADVVEAVAQARDAGALWHLTLVGGDGPRRRSLDDLAQAPSRQDWLSVLVDVDPQRLDELYRSADAFALLTYDLRNQFEGFGIAFVEAASYGLPVIGGRSGGSEEAIADEVNGFVVDSVADAARALVRLAESPELRRTMGAAGLSFARRFSSAEINGALSLVYARAVSPTEISPVKR